MQHGFQSLAPCVSIAVNLFARPGSHRSPGGMLFARSCLLAVIAVGSFLGSVAFFCAERRKNGNPGKLSRALHPACLFLSSILAFSRVKRWQHGKNSCPLHAKDGPLHRPAGTGEARNEHRLLWCRRNVYRLLVTPFMTRLLTPAPATSPIVLFVVSRRWLRPPVAILFVLV